MGNLKSEVQVDPSHYNLNYDSKQRWVSYWHQIHEIMKLEPESVLEIGIGNGVVSRYLKTAGVNITTMDIDERLGPDKVGSVVTIPFNAKSFDVAACFEVLEHLPYKNFIVALNEFKKVANKYVLISLPDVNRVYKFYLHLPRVNDIQKLIPVPRIQKISHQFDGQHYWEIGKKDYPLNRITNDMAKAGLRLIKTYRVFEFRSHRFFILQVK